MRVLHVFRAPVGGLFRHVADLIKAQSEMGIETGIVCDSTTGGAYSDSLIAKLKPMCSLGVERFAMPRMPALSDIANTRRVVEIARRVNADILHGHGSKGGLHARLAGNKLGKKSLYTPHGGVLNYTWSKPDGALFLATEKYLARKGTGFAFVCDYERRTFENKIGTLGKPFVVVHNGLWPDEFKAIPPAPDATDFVFAGEMRFNKGVDMLIDAVAELRKTKPVTLTLAGDGPDLEDYKTRSQQLGLGEATRFTGRIPIQTAFSKGRIFVSPSRFESFPYVIMEAIAAELPIVSTDVGGISEVLPAEMLTRSVDVEAILNGLRTVLAREVQAKIAARELALHVKRTTTATDMTREIVELYQRL
jgi:glycosyltransferase involved in cell wall biosynthesis